jgi:hypothetical protein
MIVYIKNVGAVSLSRKGHDLELLIEQYERALSDSGIKVASNEYVNGKITGKRREIDVTLRGMVGSADFLAIVECRDRKGKQDILWPEQIFGKMEGVGGQPCNCYILERLFRGSTEIRKVQRYFVKDRRGGQSRGNIMAAMPKYGTSSEPGSVYFDIAGTIERRSIFRRRPQEYSRWRHFDQCPIFL